MIEIAPSLVPVNAGGAKAWLWMETVDDAAPTLNANKANETRKQQKNDRKDDSGCKRWVVRIVGVAGLWRDIAIFVWCESRDAGCGGTRGCTAGWCGHGSETLE